jgi:hypothetical protein
MLLFKNEVLSMISLPSSWPYFVCYFLGEGKVIVDSNSAGIGPSSLVQARRR